MIIFPKRWGAFNLLGRVYGSPWPRAAVLALQSTLLAVLVSVFVPAIVASKTDPSFVINPSAYATFAGFATFLITFRTNLSFSRYMEAITSVKAMSNKWTDAAIQIVAGTEVLDEKVNQVSNSLFRGQILHLLSLLHGLALQRLRGDEEPENLTTAPLYEHTDPKDTPKADPGLNEYWLSIRNKHILSTLILPSGTKHFKAYWNAHPLPVLAGLSPAEANLIRASVDPVYLVLSWLQRIVGKYAESVTVPAVMSRFFTVLADGMAGYEGALKIANSPFPFPLAQSMAILVYVMALITPFTMAHLMQPAWLVGIANFLIVFGVFLLNEVAQEIEEPFKYDPNDLPLTVYQHDFNRHLVTALLRGTMPPNITLGQANRMVPKVTRQQALNRRNACSMAEADNEGSSRNDGSEDDLECGMKSYKKGTDRKLQGRAMLKSASATAGQEWHGVQSGAIASAAATWNNHAASADAGFVNPSGVDSSGVDSSGIDSSGVDAGGVNSSGADVV